jgi:hypothetical protein
VYLKELINGIRMKIISNLTECDSFPSEYLQIAANLLSGTPGTETVCKGWTNLETKEKFQIF